MREQFMTIQVNGRVVTGLTSDGRFVRHRWRGPLPTVGAMVSDPAPAHRFNWALAATAALLILILQVPFLAPFAQAGTLVTVDINPSFELMLTPAGRVVNAKALNADAEPILQAVKPLPPALPDALGAIIDATAAAGKLKTDGDNLILIGVAPGWRGLPKNTNLSGLEEAVAADLDRLNVDGIVRVAGVRPADLAKARLNKLSVNRYVLVRDMKAKGQDVSLDEARGKTTGQLIKDHGMTPDQVIPGRRGGPHKKDKDGKPSTTDGTGADKGTSPGSAPAVDSSDGKTGSGSGSTGTGDTGPGKDGSGKGSGTGGTGTKGGKEPGKSPGH